MPELRGTQPWLIHLAYTVTSVGLVVLAAPGLMALWVLRAGDAGLVHQLTDPVALALLTVQTVLSALDATWWTHRWGRSAAPPAATGGTRLLLGATIVPFLVTVPLAASHPARWTLTALICGFLVLYGLLLRWPTRAALLAGALLIVGTALLQPRLAGVATALTLWVALTHLSLWLAAQVHASERSREITARLAVAEERLRFSRDLHDVTGRDLSAISVQAELVARLVERSDARALTAARDLAQYARSSLTETRALSRGYRPADLQTELRGTVSLLRSAGISVAVRGSAEDIDGTDAERAAWVLREAGTNILRHSDARTVLIAFAHGGLVVENDGLRGESPMPFGTGLTGLVERLGIDGSLTTEIIPSGGASRPARFRLQAQFVGIPAEAPGSRAATESEAS